MKNISVIRVSFLYILFSSVLYLIFSLYLFFVLHDNFKGIIGLLLAIIILLPRIIYSLTVWKTILTPHRLIIIETVITTSISFNNIGALGLYVQFHYYDMILHIFIPMVVGWIFSLIINSWQQHKGEVSHSLMQFQMALVIVLLLFVWEGYEYGIDWVFGTHMYGQPGEQLDTFFDIIAGLVGLAIALVWNHIYFFSLGHGRHVGNDKKSVSINQ